MKEYHGKERRRYIRLQSVFPVEFRFISSDGKKELSGPIQGFTSDVSEGGILLRVNSLSPQCSEMLAKKNPKVRLDIEIPVGAEPVETFSHVAWSKTVKTGKKTQYFIGLSFEKIDAKERKRLVGYAGSLYRAPKLVGALLLALLIALGMNRVDELRLRRENRLLVMELTDIVGRRADLFESMDEAENEKNFLMTRLKLQEENLAVIEQERDRITSRDRELERTRDTLVNLESLLQTAYKDKAELQGRLDELASREESRLKELAEIETARQRLEEATADNMYRWLKVHQHKRTGLVQSYEGDAELKKSAFTYDQSLVAQVFLINDDIASARLMLDFFENTAETNKGGFTNAYVVNNGYVSEYTVHCGPNIWLGIAFMQYMNKTGTDRYLSAACRIGDWLMEFQEEDPDHGIKGGPEVDWFSTEHNLDAYAFFNMLYEKTDKQEYKEAAGRAVTWVKEHAYTENEGRILRGKGDSTIATDTFAWAIAAVGPKNLLDKGMDPDAIMAFAEANCSVTVDFERPDGKVVKVTGFDFAKHRNIARGGVVSSEWTAQMVVSLKMMSDFYLEHGDPGKAKDYNDKADFYLNELEKMVISSPSRSGQGAGCLPYATLAKADTGHGWRTPGGKDTGSVSGTAYGIFAIRGYNPLELQE